MQICRDLLKPEQKITPTYLKSVLKPSVVSMAVLFWRWTPMSCPKVPFHLLPLQNGFSPIGYRAQTRQCATHKPFINAAGDMKVMPGAQHMGCQATCQAVPSVYWAKSSLKGGISFGSFQLHSNQGKQEVPQRENEKVFTSAEDA